MLSNFSLFTKFLLLKKKNPHPRTPFPLLFRDREREKGKEKERETEREGEGEREKNGCEIHPLAASRMHPHWGRENLQPRYVCT